MSETDANILDFDATKLTHPAMKSFVAGLQKARPVQVPGADFGTKGSEEGGETKGKEVDGDKKDADVETKNTGTRQELAEPTGEPGPRPGAAGASKAPYAGVEHGSKHISVEGSGQIKLAKPDGLEGASAQISGMDKIRAAVMGMKAADECFKAHATEQLARSLGHGVNMAAGPESKKGGAGDQEWSPLLPSLEGIVGNEPLKKLIGQIGETAKRHAVEPKDPSGDEPVLDLHGTGQGDSSGYQGASAEPQTKGDVSGHEFHGNQWSGGGGGGGGEGKFSGAAKRDAENAVKNGTAIKTNNEGGGFHNTTVLNQLGDKPTDAERLAADKHAAAAYHHVATQVAKDNGVDKEVARNYLDSAYGRHLADAMTTDKGLKSDMTVREGMLKVHGSDKKIAAALKQIREQTDEGFFRSAGCFEKDIEPFEKAGRVLSGANESKLREARDNVAEILKADVPIQVKALARVALKNIEDVLAAMLPLEEGTGVSKRDVEAGEVSAFLASRACEPELAEAEMVIHARRHAIAGDRIDGYLAEVFAQ